MSRHSKSKSRTKSRTKTKSKSKSIKASSPTKTPIYQRMYKKVKQTITNRWKSLAGALVAGLIIMFKLVPEYVKYHLRKELKEIAEKLKEDPNFEFYKGNIDNHELRKKIEFIHMVNYVLTGDRKNFKRFTTVLDGPELEKYILREKGITEDIIKAYRSCPLDNPDCKQEHLSKESDTHKEMLERYKNIATSMVEHDNNGYIASQTRQPRKTS